MEWILAGFVILALAAGAIIGSGRWGSMPPVVDDRFPGLVPAGPLDAADLRDVRFSVVPRGYSMVQVDALLARLADQLDQTAGETPAHPVHEVAGEPVDEVLTTSDAGATALGSAATPMHEAAMPVFDDGEHRSL